MTSESTSVIRYRVTRLLTLLTALATCPAAIAQSDEDQEARQQSAVMVFESDDGESTDASAFHVTVGPDGASNVKMFRMQDGKLVPVEGGGGMAFMTDGSDGMGPRIFHGGEMSGKRMAKFLDDHPTADADEDGNLSIEEMRAFRVAKAMSDPRAVLEQFPHADENGDGMLDTLEATRLAGPAMVHPPAMPRIQLMLSEDSPHGTVEIHQEEADGPHVSVDVSIESDEAVAADGAYEYKFATNSVVRDEFGERRTEYAQRVGHDGVEEMTLTVDGEEIYHGPPPQRWLDEADLIEPTREEVADTLALIEEAESDHFLEMHPDADVDGDGFVTTEERHAYHGAQFEDLLSADPWTSQMTEGAETEMPEHHRVLVEEVLRAHAAERADNPEVVRQIREALGQTHQGLGDVVAAVKRKDGKDPWVALKDEYVVEHDFPAEAREVADEICAAAIEARDKLIEQIEAIEKEHAEVLREEAARRAERSKEDGADEDAGADAGSDDEPIAESKPARHIRELKAKIEDIRKRKLVGGLEKIREKIVR